MAVEIGLQSVTRVAHLWRWAAIGPTWLLLLHQGIMLFVNLELRIAPALPVGHQKVIFAGFGELHQTAVRTLSSADYENPGFLEFLNGPIASTIHYWATTSVYFIWGNSLVLLNLVFLTRVTYIYSMNTSLFRLTVMQTGKHSPGSEYDEHQQLKALFYE